MKLILFDIDETLVQCGGAGTRSMHLAFQDIFGIENAFEGIHMSGRTDPQIIREALVKHRIVQDGLLPRILDTYIVHLSKEIHNTRKSVKPGISDVLNSLALHKDAYLLGLLTGNIERGARIKLKAFGLSDYFPSGAFGDDDENRNNLLPVAVDRFRRITGREITFKECIIIGDTPRDVECALVYGASCIAVATGHYSIDELKKTGATAAVKDLSDTAQALTLISTL